MNQVDRPELNESEVKVLDALVAGSGRYLTMEEISSLAEGLHHNTIHARMFYLRKKGFDFQKQTRRNPNTGRPYYAYRIGMRPPWFDTPGAFAVKKDEPAKENRLKCKNPQCGVDEFYFVWSRDRRVATCGECGKKQ